MLGKQYGKVFPFQLSHVRNVNVTAFILGKKALYLAVSRNQTTVLITNTSSQLVTQCLEITGLCDLLLQETQAGYEIL